MSQDGHDQAADSDPEEEPNQALRRELLTALVILAVLGGFFGGIVLGMTVEPWGLGVGLALGSVLVPFVLGAIRLPGTGSSRRDRLVLLLITLVLAGATAYAAVIGNDTLAVFSGLATLVAFVAWYSRR